MNRITVYPSLLAACLLCAAPCALAVPPSEALVRTVRCTEIAFSRAVEQKDRAAFASLVDDDARFVGSGILRGRDAVVAGWSVFLDNDYPRLAWRPKIVEVLEGGELALSRGPYLLQSMNDEGGIEESWGIFNSVWRRGDDGRWRVVFDAGHPGHGPMPQEARDLLAARDDCSRDPEPGGA